MHVATFVPNANEVTTPFFFKIYLLETMFELILGSVLMQFEYPQIRKQRYNYGISAELKITWPLHLTVTAYRLKRLSHLDIEKQEVFMTFEIIQKVYYQRMKATFLSGKTWYILLTVSIQFVSVLCLLSWRHSLQAESSKLKFSSEPSMWSLNM